MLLHSLKFDIRSDSFDFGKWPESLYRHNDRLEDFPANSRSLSLHAEREGAAGSIRIEPITADTGTFAEIGLLGGMCWYAGGRFYSRSTGEFPSNTEFVPAQGIIRTILGGRYLDLSPDAVVALLLKQIMQSFVLPFFRLKFLHGAVVTRDGMTVMLSGRGGAGKSTTALRLLADGYSLLSDDGPLFTHAHGTTWALSSLDFSQVTPATLDLLPFLRDAVSGQRDHRGKYRIRADSLQPDESWRLPHRVTHIVLLDRGSYKRPDLVGMKRSDVTASLMGEAMTVFRSSVFSSDEIFREHSKFTFDVITGLMRDADTFRLEFADEHLDSIPALLAGLHDA